MKQLIDYQLQRAAASGRVSLATPVPVRPIVDKIVAALNKVYADKGIEIRVAIEPDVSFLGDSGDLTEMLGNLLDNASKWCQRFVDIRAAETEGQPPALEITVDDDGPGIPDTERSRVLERGARADNQVPGHGLGLAMVADTVALYRGQLLLENRPSGGLRAILRFPVISA